MKRRSSPPAYKELTLRQMRCFLETARLGSFAAAAEELGLTAPTVWEQVHSLEKRFQAKLVETSRGGCRLTEAGQQLANMATQPVAEFKDLKRRFDEARARIRPRLTIASFQRIIIEDLPGCIQLFEKAVPDVVLDLQEMMFGGVMDAVDSGQADIGLTPEIYSARDNPTIVCESAYELDILLITPQDHPLARRRSVHPKDLKGYPLAQSPQTFDSGRGPHDQRVLAAFSKYGILEEQDRHLGLMTHASVCRYVELGFGIGIVAAPFRRQPNPKLYERSMSRHFGTMQVFFVYRRKPSEGEPADEFCKIVKSELRRSR